MAWEIVAMWLIVMATVIWFVQDERLRVRRNLDMQMRQHAGLSRQASAVPSLSPSRAGDLGQPNRRRL